MMLFFQSESTAANRRIPFKCVDATDRVTPETGLSFSAGDLKLSKNQAAEANHAGTVTEIGGGVYSYQFTADELDTTGFVALRLNKSGVDGNVFVAQVLANNPNGNVSANVKAINDSTAAAIAAQAVYDACAGGTVDTSTFTPTNSGSCVFEASGITEATADHFNGRSIVFTSGVMLASAVDIVDYEFSGNSKAKFTCTQAQETPTNGITFRVA